MSRLTRLIRQIVVLAIGVPLLIVGIVLIPLPGPGILICFIALLILSWGFDSAKVYVDKCKAIFAEIYRRAKEQADKIEKK
jgi:uncharacterized protein (TIGR02611 family)